MEKFNNNVAFIFESLFGNQTSAVNFLYFVSDHYKEHEVECLALIAMKDTFTHIDEWFRTAHHYVFRKIPYAVINEYHIALMSGSVNTNLYK